MSVYPHKNRSGALTGRFVVEVQIAGKRLRQVTPDFSQVKAVEASLAQRLSAGEGQAKVDNRDRVAPRDLSELLARGADAIWGSTTVHKTTPVRVERIAAIIGPVRLTDLRTTDVDLVIETLRSEGLAPTTVNQYLSALHRLLSWGAERGWGPTKPINYAWQAKPEQTLRLINDGEDVKLIAHLEAQDDIGREVADFVRVALFTGLRRNELLRREPQDLYEADGTTWLRVTKTKTKTQRDVPLTEEASAILKTRLPFRITQGQLRLRWNAARKALGLKDEGRFVVHALRHTFGTRLIRSGVDAFTTQQIMGHANIQTTQRYVHVGDQMKLQAVRKLAQSFSTVQRSTGEQAAEEHE
jgi:integrase/recombinase XerD